MADVPAVQKDVFPAVREAFDAGSPMQRLFGAVLDELGGVEFVVTWAEENPDSFMRLLLAANPVPVSGPGSPANTQINLNMHPGLAPGPLDVTPDAD